MAASILPGQFLDAATTGSITGVTAGSTIVVFSLNCSIADSLNGSYGSPLVSVTAAGVPWQIHVFINSAPGTLNFTATTYGGSCAFVAIEVGSARVTAYTPAALAVDTAPGTGTDGQTTGNLTPTGAPGIFIGLGADSLSFNSPPTQGTGFASYGLFINAGLGALARIESKNVSVATAAPVTFTATNGGADAVTLGIFLEDFQAPVSAKVVVSSPKPVADSYGRSAAVVGLIAATASSAPTIRRAIQPISDAYGYSRVIKGQTPVVATAPPTIRRAIQPIVEVYGYSQVIKGQTPAAVTAVATVLGSRPQYSDFAPFPTSNQIIAGAVYVDVSFQQTYGSAPQQTAADYGSSRAVFVNQQPPAAVAPPRILGSSPQPSSTYGASVIVVGAVPPAVASPTIFGSKPQPLSTYGASTVVIGTAPPPTAAPTILGSAPQPTSDYGSSRQCIGQTPAPVAPPAIYGARLAPESYPGTSRAIQVAAVPASVTATCIQSAPQPAVDYGSSRSVAGLTPAAVQPIATCISSSPQPAADYGYARVVIGLAPAGAAALVATVVRVVPQPPIDYGATRAVIGLVPAPTVYPPDVLGSAPIPAAEYYGFTKLISPPAVAAQAPAGAVIGTPAGWSYPAAPYGSSVAVRGLVPAAAPVLAQEIYGSAPVPQLPGYGSSVVVSAFAPAGNQSPLAVIYRSIPVPAQDYGKSTIIAGLAPPPVLAPVIYGSSPSPVLPYGWATAVPGAIPASNSPPEIYGSNPTFPAGYGYSNPIAGLAPTPAVLPPRVLGAPLPSWNDYGRTTVVTGLVPIVAVLPPVIYRSAPTDSPYYGRVTIVLGVQNQPTASDWLGVSGKSDQNSLGVSGKANKSSFGVSGKPTQGPLLAGKSQKKR
jgi:hypothetical protein